MYLVRMVFILTRHQIFNLSTENIINNISKDNKIIGIGETGLDFIMNIQIEKSKNNYFKAYTCLSRKFKNFNCSFKIC